MAGTDRAAKLAGDLEGGQGHEGGGQEPQPGCGGPMARATQARLEFQPE